MSHNIARVHRHPGELHIPYYVQQYILQTLDPTSAMLCKSVGGPVMHLNLIKGLIL